jgi:hypothetical protein
MTQDPDERAHLISEYRINAARMRANANVARKPEDRAEFEKIARELDQMADYLGSSSKG